MNDAMDPRHSGSAMPSGRWKARKVTTPDDIEAAARRVYAIMPALGELRIHRVGEPDPRFAYKTLRGPISWESAEEDYRNYCRQIATAVLGVDEPR